MRFVILTALLGIAMAGCNSLNPGCIIQNRVTDVAASTIAVKLQCSNPDAVLASVKELVAPIGLCKQETGIIADSFCPLLVGTLVAFSTKPIPASWGCTAEDAKATLSAALLEACRKIPVSGK
jgi:hypothetical protein